MHESSAWIQHFNPVQPALTPNVMLNRHQASVVQEHPSALEDDYMDAAEEHHHTPQANGQHYEVGSPSERSSNVEEDDAQEDEEEGDIAEDDHPEGVAPTGENGTAATSATTQSSSVEKELEFLKSNVSFLSHQIMKLMSAMNVALCQCTSCNECPSKQQALQKEDSLRQLLEKLISNGNGHAENGIRNEVETSKATTPQAAPASQTPDPISQFVPNSNSQINALSTLSGIMNLQESPRRGRKSKYCSPAEKKAVADYAQMHGASAAARKFNIPPPVAAYYHRKEYKREPKFQRGPPTQVVDRLKLSLDGRVGRIESPGTTSGDDVESAAIERQLTASQTSAFPAFAAGFGHQSTIPSAASSTPNTPVSATFPRPLPTDVLRSEAKNVAHTTGSPGFLRGRGRGRPKLIGDELDAELVEYMVKVKELNPQGRMTASQALDIARQYILEKAPGLLEEHGGHIKLKLTWAMKLVSRISERQREIQLGLPAGSLQNMTRSPTQTASGFTAGISQQMFGQHSGDFASQNGNQQEVTATPEIVNVRELKLPMSEGNDGEPTGEITEGLSTDFTNTEIFKNLLANMKAEDFTNHFPNIASDVVEDALQPASTAAF